MYTGTPTHKCARTHTCAHTYTYTHAHIHAHTRTQTYKHTHHEHTQTQDTSTHTCAQTHTCTHIQTHTCMYTHRHTSTYTHNTHTHAHTCHVTCPLLAICFESTAGSSTRASPRSPTTQSPSSLLINTLADLISRCAMAYFCATLPSPPIQHSECRWTTPPTTPLTTRHIRVQESGGDVWRNWEREPSSHRGVKMIIWVSCPTPLVSLPRYGRMEGWEVDSRQ